MTPRTLLAGDPLAAAGLVPSLSETLATSRVLNGPLRPATGPDDHEGLGRERFWDQTPEQRGKAVSGIIANANCGPLNGPDKEFARGWLSEHRRFRANSLLNHLEHDTDSKTVGASE